MMKFKEHAEKSNAKFIINTVTEIKEENDLKNNNAREEILQKLLLLAWVQK